MEGGKYSQLPSAYQIKTTPFRLVNKELQDKLPAKFWGYWVKVTTVKVQYKHVFDV